MFLHLYGIPAFNITKDVPKILVFSPLLSSCALKPANIFLFVLLTFNNTALASLYSILKTKGQILCWCKRVQLYWFQWSFTHWHQTRIWPYPILHLTKYLGWLKILCWNFLDGKLGFLFNSFFHEKCLFSIEYIEFLLKNWKLFNLKFWFSFFWVKSQNFLQEITKQNKNLTSATKKLSANKNYWIIRWYIHSGNMCLYHNLWIESWTPFLLSFHGT